MNNSGRIHVRRLRIVLAGFTVVLAGCKPALIPRLYPRNEATGFRTGQLRDGWRIDFPLTALAITQLQP